MAHSYQHDEREAGSARTASCVVCEEMLTDALDGLLTAADQSWFDAHVATCPLCHRTVGDAQRGAALLEVLRLDRPEPSADLFDRILARTTGAEAATSSEADQQLALDAHPDVRVAGQPTLSGFAAHQPEKVRQPLHVPAPVPNPVSTNLLSFPVRRRGLSQMVLEPRLAMTAAMAFFSIALTMNLTGIKLNELHADTLRPATLRRSFFETRASVVRSYDNLRVVHVLESRVTDLREASGLRNEAAPGVEPLAAPPQPHDEKPVHLRQQSSPASTLGPLGQLRLAELEREQAAAGGTARVAGGLL